MLTLMAAVSLHAYPAGAIYALICAANGKAPGEDSAMPENLMLDVPERSRTTLRSGETYAFGLRILAMTDEHATALLSRVVEGLHREGANPSLKGTALGGNFNVSAVEDIIAGTLCADGTLLQPLRSEHIEREFAIVSNASKLTLRFESPLRMKRPKHERNIGGGWFDSRYFNADLFLRRVCRRVRELGLTDLMPEEGVTLAETESNQLQWLDFTYGRGGERKGLGGACGVVTMAISSPELILPLVWGQYTGVGETTRFGLGMMRLGELGSNPYPCGRATTLLDLALSHPACKRLAVEYDLPPGRWDILAENIRTDIYEPKPILQVTTPGRKGAGRLLSIPDREDIIAQRGVLATVAPALDLFFEESSLGYRKGLGRHRAAARIRNAHNEGFRWAVRSDFHAFFDHIDHDLLRAKLDVYLADPPLVKLIMRWVVSGAPSQGRGLPTGAPISPLLTNLFLDGFDEQVAEEGACLVRYADDFLVLFKEEEEAARLLARVGELAEDLRLQLNAEKTSVISLCEGFDFLGFRFQLRDGWEHDGATRPRRIEELGWEDCADSGWNPPRQILLCGELPRPAPTADATAILGPGLAEIDADGGLLHVRHTNQHPVTVLQPGAIDTLVLFGAVGLTPAALEVLSKNEIACLFASRNGNLNGAFMAGEFPQDAVLITAQVAAAADPERRLAIARALIAAKLRNYAALADACPGRDGDADTGPALRALADSCAEAPTVESLLGLEGSGAAKWYGALKRRLPEGFVFERRHAPAASDPVNVLLNIAQSYLYRIISLKLLQAGFAPACGILHKSRGNHAALASDVQEPFRHLMDRAVLEVLPGLSARDFIKDDRGHFPLRVQPWVAKRLAATIIYGLALPCRTAERDSAQPHRAHILRLIRGLRAHLREDAPLPTPFTHPTNFS